MNTVKEELQTKTLSETKLELIEWILTVNNLDVIQIILQKKREAEKAAYNKLFWEVAGSWQTEETGTELANQLYEDRNDYSREIE